MINIAIPETKNVVVGFFITFENGFTIKSMAWFSSKALDRATIIPIIKIIPPSSLSATTNELKTPLSAPTIFFVKNSPRKNIPNTHGTTLSFFKIIVIKIITMKMI